MEEEKYTCDNCRNYDIDSPECENCIAAFIDNVSLKPSGWKPKNNTTDMVNHPQHYMTKTGLETIDVIEAFTEGMTGIEAVCTANVIKYICRWKKKNGLEDLKKAEWYIQKLIEHVDDGKTNKKESK